MNPPRNSARLLTSCDRSAAQLANGDRKLRFESLEYRRMLATLVVNNDSDLVNGNISSIVALMADNGGDGVSLREAIEATNQTAGADEIMFAADLAGATITLGGTELSITDPITIDALALSEKVTIDANRLSRVFYAIQPPGFGNTSPDITLNGLEITGGMTTVFGKGGRGAGISSAGVVELNQTAVTNNHTEGFQASGGGIFAGLLVLNKSRVSGNSTLGDQASGGGAYSRGNSYIFDSVIHQNETRGFDAPGGGAFVGREGYFDQAIVSNNNTFGRFSAGGGIFAEEELEIIDTSITDNRTDGRSGIGGGVRGNSTVTLSGSTVKDNRTTGAQGSGGGISSLTSVYLSGSTVADNSTAGDLATGGGISAFFTVSLSESNVSGNFTTGDNATGGGLHTFRNIILEHSTVSGNQTQGVESHGGGISAGRASILGSTVSGNSTTGNSARGGGIITNGELTLANSTVSGNSTNGNIAHGGGIYVLEGNVTLSSSTVSGNSTASSTSHGGGIVDLSGSYFLTIENTIIAGNVQNRILGVSSGTPNDLMLDLDRSLSINYSLIGDTSSGLTEYQLNDITNGTNNLQDLDPLLGPLADNGGPTQTHALLPGSPAINAGGDSVVEADDQRGFTRNVDGVDIGAYEAQVTPSADFDSDGDVDGTDFLTWQRGFGKPNAIRADGNSDDDNDTDASDLLAWVIQFGEFGLPVSAALGSSDETVDSEAATNATLIDVVMALVFLESEPIESLALVEEPTIIESTYVATDTADKLFSSTYKARDAVTATTSETARDPQLWLEEELLDKVFD